MARDNRSTAVATSSPEPVSSGVSGGPTPSVSLAQSRAHKDSFFRRVHLPFAKRHQSAVDRSVVIKQGEPFVICENLVKIYKIADIEVFALQGLDLVINKGELMSIIGASGSGKSTLLNVLGGLDSPTGGRATVGGWNLSKMNHAEAVHYKREVVGFVWQNVSRNLVPYLTALENVQLPMVINGKSDKEWAKELLDAVGLADRMYHRPKELSGGQQQRVAIAIALANKPDMLLADEPTGSLDRKSGEVVLDVFRNVRDRFGVTVVIVTHDMSMAHSVDRYVRIRDGKISSESVRRADADQVAARAAAVGGSAAAPGSGNPSLSQAATHDEYVVLDSAGRLQVPEEYRQRLGITNRARMQLHDGKVVILPPE